MGGALSLFEYFIFVQSDIGVNVKIYNDAKQNADLQENGIKENADLQYNGVKETRICKKAS